MDKIKRVFLFAIPVSICNFRCHYCYLSHRSASFQGIHPEMKYSPQEFANAMSVERIGGLAYGNFCADGETLLVRDIDLYVKAFVEQGHYAEVVSNMTVTPILDKFLGWDKDLLKHIEFKCSFHYLELKKKGLLETFANNVNRAWAAGASVNIEITPSDELIPYIDEVKAFSMKEFGALPHITIARDDHTKEIDYLTNLDMKEYDRVWSQFESGFWRFKKTIFGKKQKGFCYAGKWSLFINLCTGQSRACYCGESLGDAFAHPEQPFPEAPIGKCPIAHCYNGHALLTLGVIPHVTDVRYGDIRDRICKDETHWLQPELKCFFNSKLEESNAEYSMLKRTWYHLSDTIGTVKKATEELPALIANGSKRLTKKVLGKEQYERLKKKIKKGD